MTTFHQRILNLQQVLKWTFGLVAIVAGIDKFFHLLVDWNGYLHPAIPDVFGVTPLAAIYVVGVIEIIAGLLVLIVPKIGAAIVGVWLLVIVINLLAQGEFYDVAVRDTVMAISAFVLARLTMLLEHEGVLTSRGSSVRG